MPVRLLRLLNNNLLELRHIALQIMECLCRLNYGNSSTGRVAVSKTVGCGFDPRLCKQRNMDKIISYIKESYDELMHKVELLDRVFLMGSTVATIIGF